MKVRANVSKPTSLSLSYNLFYANWDNFEENMLLPLILITLIICQITEKHCGLKIVFIRKLSASWYSHYLPLILAEIVKTCGDTEQPQVDIGPFRVPLNRNLPDFKFSDKYQRPVNNVAAENDGYGSIFKYLFVIYSPLQ